MFVINCNRIKCINLPFASEVYTAININETSGPDNVTTNQPDMPTYIAPTAQAEVGNMANNVFIGG